MVVRIDAEFIEDVVSRSETLARWARSRHLMALERDLIQRALRARLRKSGSGLQ